MKMVIKSVSKILGRGQYVWSLCQPPPPAPTLELRWITRNWLFDHLWRSTLERKL